MDTKAKNPKRVEAGKKAAVTRWGEPRIVRLDDLQPEVRLLILALVDAARAYERDRHTHD